jgi:hypothetical protein
MMQAVSLHHSCDGVASVGQWACPSGRHPLKHLDGNRTQAFGGRYAGRFAFNRPAAAMSPSRGTTSMKCNLASIHRPDERTADDSVLTAAAAR